MLKLILTVIVPVLLPTLAFLGYVWFLNRRAVAAGGAPRSYTAGAPWPLLIFGGIGLAAVVLVVFLGQDSAPPGSHYVPAYLDETGRLVPARVVPPGEPVPLTRPDPAAGTASPSTPPANP